MKKILNFIVEINLAIIISLFTSDFILWFAIILLLILAWHHINEYRLLKYLNLKQDNKFSLLQLGTFSQTEAYHRHRIYKEKCASLRLLSQINKNIKYLPDAIIICQHNGNISWCNSIAQQMFDFCWNKKVQKNIFDAIFYEQFKHYFFQSKKRRPLVLLTYNQRYIEVQSHAYNSHMILVVARDITDMIHLLNSRQKFLSNINHELRTPLTVLQGYLEILADNNTQNPLQKKAIFAMQEQSQRMEHLLQQFNFLAKIETTSDKDFRTFDMSAMINSLRKDTDILNTYNHHIEFIIQPNIIIFGNEFQLRSAVSNLIYNAIKHSGKQCHIQIKWETCEQGIKFNVIDNGVGISPQHIPHLTERFYRVDESRSHLTGGSGLGLAIVKHTLLQYHSHLNIESTKTKGSSFSFIIPKRFVISKK
ncbi:TPA: phosphate regulon sensor histidine kinase PhoR [Haemophilus influenzae]